MGFIETCERDLPAGDGIKATALYACNRNVDAENASELAALPPPSHSFRAQDSISVDCQVANGDQGCRVLRVSGFPQPTGWLAGRGCSEVLILTWQA